MFRSTSTALFMALAMALVAVSTSSQSPAPSDKTVTFMGLISGYWTNKAQIREDKAFGRPVHDFIELAFVPVSVPALDSPYTLLLVESINGDVNRVNIIDFTEVPDGTTRMHPYNVTGDTRDITGFKASKPPRDINLQLEDLQDLPASCDVSFVGVEPNVFFGLFPDCRQSSTKLWLYYELVNTCNTLSGFAPKGGRETSNPLPYVLVPEVRYALLPEMVEDVDNYEAPCNCN